MYGEVFFLPPPRGGRGWGLILHTPSLLGEGWGGGRCIISRNFNPTSKSKISVLPQGEDMSVGDDSAYSIPFGGGLGWGLVNIPSKY